jgi:hypothetical protein
MRAHTCSLLAVLLASCSRPAMALPASPPPSNEATAPQAAPADTLSICVILDGQIREVSATVRPATGDTLIGDRPYRELHPASSPPYAAGESWFVGMEPISAGKGRYSRKVRYGLPRVLRPSDLQRYGEYMGIPTFVESGSTGFPEVVYLPVSPGCVFQPYQSSFNGSEVRG